MKSRITESTCVLIFAAFANSSVSAEVIHFTPGPYGGTKVITPWGDFIATKIGDSIWVGTEREWNDVKADSVAQENGMRRAKIAGAGRNEITYISSEGRNVSLGNGKLLAVTTSIEFGARPDRKTGRPPKPAGSEYVEIVWHQSEVNSVRAAILVDNQTVQPTSCSRWNAFFYCSFIADRDLLTKPADIFFYTRNQRPSAIHVESIAEEAHEGLLIKYRHSQGEPISEDDSASLQSLHELDAAIPDAKASLPDAPLPNKISLKICRNQSGLAARNEQKAELINPTNFSKRFNNGVITYTVFHKGQVLPSAGSCFTAPAMLTKNTARADTPQIGDSLRSEDALAWFNGNPDPVDISLEASVVAPQK